MVDGWGYDGDVEGLVDFGANGTLEVAGTYVDPSGNYPDQTVRTFGSGLFQVALFPADAGDVQAFADFVTAGRSILGVTLTLMPDLAPAPSVACPSPVDPLNLTVIEQRCPFGFAHTAVGAVDSTSIGTPLSPDLATALATPFGASGGAWSEWTNGIALLDSLATDHANVLIN